MILTVSTPEFLHIKEHIPDPCVEFGYGSPHNLDLRWYEDESTGERTIEFTCWDCKQLLIEFKEFRKETQDE